mgnify:CR=1 FL=1
MTPPSDQIWLKTRGGHVELFWPGTPKMVRKLTVSPLETPKKCQKFSPAAGSSKSGQISEKERGVIRKGGGHVELTSLIYSNMSQKISRLRQAKRTISLYNYTVIYHEIFRACGGLNEAFSLYMQ